MKCKSILVVEDDEDIRAQLIRALVGEGYQVHAAENGRLALEFLLAQEPEQRPGCMILDLMMPELDGRALMELITRDHRDRLGALKVLIATAKGSPVNPEAVPGTLGRIQKPFDLDELFRAVEEHCGKP